MNYDTYRISNLLTYQVKELSGYLKENTFTVIQNQDSRHFHDVLAGLNDTEYKFLSALGFCVRKHIVVGQLAILNTIEG